VASIDASMLDASPGLSGDERDGSLAVYICVESPDRPKATQAFRTVHVRFGLVGLLVFVLPSRLLLLRPSVLRRPPAVGLDPPIRGNATTQRMRQPTRTGYSSLSCLLKEPPAIPKRPLDPKG
jgi:hypothetical protein